MRTHRSTVRKTRALTYVFLLHFTACAIYALWQWSTSRDPLRLVWFFATVGLGVLWARDAFRFRSVEVRWDENRLELRIQEEATRTLDWSEITEIREDGIEFHLFTAEKKGGFSVAKACVPDDLAGVIRRRAKDAHLRRDRDVATLPSSSSTAQEGEARV